MEMEEQKIDPKIKSDATQCKVRDEQNNSCVDGVSTLVNLYLQIHATLDALLLYLVLYLTSHVIGDFDSVGKEIDNQELPTLRE